MRFADRLPYHRGDGANSPLVAKRAEFAAQMPCSTEVLVNVKDMAQQMASSDLAIGAAGSTS